MKKLEAQIQEKLIPAIIGRSTITDEMRMIFSLPARLGGMGFQDPSAESDFEYKKSTVATAQLRDAIFNQHSSLDIDEDSQLTTMNDIRQKKRERYEQLREHVKNSTSEVKFKLIQLSAEKGASSWLTSLPLKEYGFRLNKQQFQDAIAMRYDLKIKDVAKNCVCVEISSINHCLSCKNGGFVNIRHNSVRDTTHELLKEVCKDVQLEPALLPVTGKIYLRAQTQLMVHDLM